jgi:NAD(P)-dependent dehydrogenase (short-subunit alcohol dehydrogenase family)
MNGSAKRISVVTGGASGIGAACSSPTANAALRRLVEPAETARVVGVFLSDAASAMTGVNVPVDCGWLAGTSWSTYGGLREGNG